FIGGGGDERALALDVDGSGNAYVTGWTSSANFPTRPGAHDRRLDGDSDAFVVRLDPTGARLPAATYLGGSDIDAATSIMLDGKGGVHVGGYARSNNFPTTAGAYDTVRGGLQDAFLTVLNMTLTDVSYSTYIGGSGYDSVVDLWVDGYDNAYISGGTTSWDFPVTFGSFDTKYKGATCSFILKFDIDDSSVTFAGYIDVNQLAIVVDEFGHLYATGYTHADDLPVTDGAYDTEYNGNWEAVVLKLSLDGSGFKFLTYLGGSSIDYGYDICLNATGCPSVTGQTYSRDFPTTPNAYDVSRDAYSRDVFYSMLNANGSILLYSTYIGGNDREWGSAIAMDGEDHVVIGGVTNSTDFPTTVGAFDVTRDGDYDTFVLKMPVETIDPRPPSEPLNLSAMGGDGYVGISWARPADDGGIGIRGYRLFRGNSSDNLTWLADLEPLETSYFDRAVENGMTYWYTVVAFNQMGSGPKAPIMNATALGPPSPPVGLIAEGGRGNVSLDWRPPLRDGGLPVLGYRLYRGASMPDIELLADLSNVTSYLDTDVV
ncbi:MAG: SBBP repeat-containing protein, partial [Thermoplasmata archaeon]|nr:SBBP repeat-containing protein [Thermoplasmata archaeon]